MVKYFDYFPQTIYNDKKVVDITKKVNFVESVKKNITLLKPYTVNEGEKPEDIAYFYYGTMDYYWLILLINDITSYYEDWVKDEDTFNKYLIKKYAEKSGDKKGYDVISWTMNETILDNVLYYVDGEGKIFSKDTIIIDNVPKYEYQHLNTPEGQKYLLETYLNSVVGFRPFRIYEYEYLNNEQKRNIVLVDERYVSKVLGEFQQKMGK